eukprot:5010850-Ditylum_brightwellii.AAC.1
MRPGRNLDVASASIGIVTIVKGSYQPPPDVNFPALVQDSIDDGEDDLVKELASPTSGNGAGASYFENVREIEVIKLQTTPKEIPESESLPMIVWIVGSIGAAVVLASCLFLFIWRRKKLKDDKYNVMEREIKNVRTRKGGLSRTRFNERQDSFTPIPLAGNGDGDELYLPHMSSRKQMRDECTVATASTSHSTGNSTEGPDEYSAQTPQ